MIKILTWKSDEGCAGVSARLHIHESGLVVDFETYEIVRWEDDVPWYEGKEEADIQGGAVTDFSRAQRHLHGDIKFDGCTNWSTDAELDEHACTRPQLVQVGQVLGMIHDAAGWMMGAKKQFEPVLSMRQIEQVEI